MSLSLSLNTALSGLRVAQSVLATLSNNIANVNTPDYSRKLVQLGSQVVGGVGAGVQVEGIESAVDRYLSRIMRQQGSSVGKVDAINTFAERLQQLFGQPGSGGTLDAALSGFFTTMQSLAQNVEQGSMRLNAVNAGVRIATQISRLASDVQDLRLQADQDMASGFAVVNSSLRELFAVNRALDVAYNTGKSGADLVDKRDALLGKVAEYMDISYFYTETGAVSISTNAGIPLLNSSLYQVSYPPQNSTAAFMVDAALQPANVYRIDENGVQTTDSYELISGGASGTATTSMVQGKIRGLMDVRDARLPQVLAQMDELAAKLRDQVNAVHNAGSNYPGVSSFTGTRLISPVTNSEWSGKVRLALLNQNGQPVSSPWSNETSGLRALTLDLSTLDTGDGAGKPSVQGIINEINYYFKQPQNKATVGDINNIRLVSGQATLPGTPAQFKFDMDLENIAGGNADFFVTSVQVLDDTNTDITSVTSTIPQAALAAANTYETTNGSRTVVVNTAAAHGFTEGQTIYLPNPGVAVNGIAAGNMGGYFTISNVSSTSFEITVSQEATATGGVNVASLTAFPKYTTAVAGELTRTKPNGQITANLTANSTSDYYIIRVNVGVKNADGSISDGMVQYRVNNGSVNNLNARYAAEAVGLGATLTIPNTNTPLVYAKLVDANGNELGKTNGAYSEEQSGYLRIETANGSQVLAIDSLDSRELGFPSNATPIPGTNRSFAHYFELNNFFVSNQATTTGDTLKNSAINMQVSSRLTANPNLISLGSLTRSLQPADPNATPLYTYERTAGDNSIIQRLAGIAALRVQFDEAGGLGDVLTDFNSYTSQVIGYSAAQASAAQTDYDSQNIIFEGFRKTLQDATGVNLDEELANTIIYQNAYAASAKTITVVDEMFEQLLGIVR